MQHIIPCGKVFGSLCGKPVRNGLGVQQAGTEPSKDKTGLWPLPQINFQSTIVFFWFA